MSSGRRDADRYTGNMSGLFGSMLGFGTAMTKWTFEQMQTAMCMLTSPGKAMDRMRHTVDNFSEAMNKPADEAAGSHSQRSGSTADEMTANPGDSYVGRKA